jgi:hypothetical protein
MKKKLLFLLAIMPCLITSIVAQVDLNNGLAAYFMLDGNVRDTSGNGNHGTIYGTPTLTSDRWGRPNAAYNFDGNGSFIWVTEIYGLPQLPDRAQNYTVCAWFKTRSNGQIILGNTSDDGWFYLHPQGFYALRDNWTAQGLAAGDQNTVDSLNWHFIAGVMEYPIMSVFYDGELVDTATFTGTLLMGPIANGGVKIGSDYDNRHFNGIIDEVRIYDRVLNLQELETLFNIQNILDTAEYYVSSPEFASKSPKVYFEGSDTLPNQDIVYNYSKYIYNENYYTDTISVEDTLKIDITITGLGDPIINEVKVYPNPANDVLWIDCTDYATMENYSLKLISSTSQEIWSDLVTEQKYSIDLSGYATGLYFLEIYDADNDLVTTRKIVLY